MGPPSYMRSVVDRNVVMRRMTVVGYWWVAIRKRRATTWLPSNDCGLIRYRASG